MGKVFGKMKGFRTVGLNVLAVAASVATHYGVLPEVDPLVQMVAIGVANLVVRKYTDTPIFSKMSTTTPILD